MLAQEHALQEQIRPAAAALVQALQKQAPQEEKAQRDAQALEAEARRKAEEARRAEQARREHAELARQIIRTAPALIDMFQRR